MALAIGDLIQIVDTQSYLGEEVVNVFYYRAETVNADGAAALESLGDFFALTVLGDITQLQVEGLLHVSRNIRNLTNGIDFFVDTSVVPGALAPSTNNYLPTFISLGFLLSRSTLLTRNGYKRFAGAPEDFVSGNTYVGGSAQIDAVETVLALTPNTLAGDEFTPVIVKRPIPDPGVGGAIMNPIASAQFRGVGTQNSRKPGRGV